MDELSQQIPTLTADSAARSAVSFSLLHIHSTSAEFAEADYLPHEVRMGGICICLQGTSCVTINEHRCEINKGDLCIFSPHMLMQLDHRSDDFEAYCLVFEVELPHDVHVPSATSLFLSIKENPCISLDEATLLRMMHYCHIFGQLEQSDHPYRPQIAHHLSMMIYYEVLEIYQHGKPLVMSTQTRQESMFRRFLFLVSKHHEHQREIAFYADQLCVTPKYLSSVVRGVSGNSAAWWINHTVITHAKNLLRMHQQMTIQQISDKLNFPNPSFFGQYFKRRVGMTPKEFRRKIF